jgi:hypothetical protein
MAAAGPKQQARLRALLRRLRRPVSSRAGIGRDDESVSGHLLGCDEVGPGARLAGNGDGDVLLKAGVSVGVIRGVGLPATPDDPAQRSAEGA